MVEKKNAVIEKNTGCIDLIFHAQISKGICAKKMSFYDQVCGQDNCPLTTMTMTIHDCIV